MVSFKRIVPKMKVIILGKNLHVKWSEKMFIWIKLGPGIWIKFGEMTKGKRVLPER